jgi:phage head maturation protease
MSEKNREQELSRIRDIVSAKREINENERTITHYINTLSIDTYDSVIIPQGMDDKRFEKNPVVPWAHDTRMPSVARSMWRQIDDTGILAKTQFYDSQFADEIWGMYKRDFLRGWSIGFDWKRGGLIWDDDDEYMELIEKYDIQGRPIVIIKDWVLFEYSAVVIPANEDALNADAIAKALREREIKHPMLRFMLVDAGIPAVRRAFPGWAEIREQEKQKDDDQAEPEAETDLNEETNEQDPERQESDLKNTIKDLRRAISNMASRIDKLETTPEPEPEETPVETLAEPEHETRVVPVDMDQLRELVRSSVRGEVSRLRGRVSE